MKHFVGNQKFDGQMLLTTWNPILKFYQRNHQEQGLARRTVNIPDTATCTCQYIYIYMRHLRVLSAPRNSTP